MMENPYLVMHSKTHYAIALAVLLLYELGLITYKTCKSSLAPDEISSLCKVCELASFTQSNSYNLISQMRTEA